VAVPEQNGFTGDQEPAHVPEIGTLMVDTRIGGRVGEFRGVAGLYWWLRPLGGGIEWEARPGDVRPADPIERLQAENARCNARSRGELL
jgi:hypothetical protein